MRPQDHDPKIEEQIKGLLANWRKRELPESRTREFIARLYKVSEERRHVIEFPRFVRTHAFATVTASIFICVLAVNYLFVPAAPSVFDIKGTVKVCRAGTNSWDFVSGSGVRLKENDILKTFDDGQADIVAPGSYHIRVKNSSEIRIARLASRAVAGDTRYELAKGRAFNYYSKSHSADRTLSIETPEAVASAIGTDFMVESVPQFGRTWVGVLEGAVRVTSKDISVLVEPGEKTVISQTSGIEKPSRLMENELLELGELYRIGTKPQVALLISAGKTRTRELLSATPLYVSSRKGDALPARMRDIIKTLNRAVETKSKERYLENVKQFEDLLAEHPDPKYNVQFSLFIAAYYEHLDEHEKSIAAFEKTVASYPDSSLVSIAQCAAGLIAEEKLGDKERASAAYKKVLENYPASPEVEEAQAGLKRLSG